MAAQDPNPTPAAPSNQDSDEIPAAPPLEPDPELVDNLEGSPKKRDADKAAVRERARKAREEQPKGKRALTKV